MENLNTVVGKLKACKHPKLQIWDVDDTLFKTHESRLKIKIMDPKSPKKQIIYKGRKQHMTTSEFGDDRKREDILKRVGGIINEDSFKDFKSSSTFMAHAKPTEHFEIALKHFGRGRIDTFFLVLTARPNMDDRKKFLQHFSNHKLNMNEEFSHITRTRSVTATPGAAGKGEVISEILSKCGSFITEIHFWDDAKSNIAKFNEISKAYPKIKFFPHHVV